MTAQRRDPLIATHASPFTKARFAALAASRGLTESGLLTMLIDTVLGQVPLVDSPMAPGRGTGDRITLRLRPGDRSLLESRAAARGMKAASYAVMLIRAHVRNQAPMPREELDALTVAVNRLASFRQELQMLVHVVTKNSPQTIDVLQSLRQTALQVDDVRQRIADVVKTNLVSWETDHVEADVRATRDSGTAGP